MTAAMPWYEDHRAQALAAWFGACPRAAVALSGGVDSILVTALARHWLGREQMRAYTAVSPSLQADNLAEARAFCAQHDIQLIELQTAELDNPDYVANRGDRCFYCKQTLFTDLEAHLQATQTNAWICTGTNRDDLGDYRPGLRAAADAGVRSPLAECNLGKADVRDLARSLGLTCWAKPASPCLSSRVPHGQAVTAEKLAAIEAGESALRALGFPIVRLRHHGDFARIEVPADQVSALENLHAQLDQALQTAGFARWEIDREGFVSGKLNRSLNTIEQGKA